MFAVGEAYKVGTNFFFFQAEDGIRDGTVTGVQTCALPISLLLNPNYNHSPKRDSLGAGEIAHRSVVSRLISRRGLAIPNVTFNVDQPRQGSSYSAVN